MKVGWIKNRPDTSFTLVNRPVCSLYYILTTFTDFAGEKRREQ